MGVVGNVNNDIDNGALWAPWLTVLVRRKWLVLTASISFAVVFFVVSKIVVGEPWEAVALARVGKVRGELVEAVAVAVDRLNSTGFQQDLVLAPEGDSDAQVLARLRRSLRARVTSSALIEIRARGNDEEEARRFVTSVVSRLQRVHAEIADPAIALMLERRTQVHTRLKTWEAQFRIVSEHLASLVRGPANARRDGDMLAATLLHEQLRSQLHDLEAEVALLDRQLDTLQTMPTSLVSAPELRQIGVGWLADTIRAALGLVFGLIFGVLLALAHPRR